MSTIYAQDRNHPNWTGRIHRSLREAGEAFPSPETAARYVGRFYEVMLVLVILALTIGWLK